MLEREIEDYLCRCVRELGGEVRKVQWIGRRGAPDRLVMLPVPLGQVQMARYAEHEAGLAPDRKMAMLLLQFAHALKTTMPCVWVELKNPDTILTWPSGPHEKQQAREHERMRAMGQRVVVIGTKEQVDELLA